MIMRMAFFLPVILSLALWTDEGNAHAFLVRSVPSVGSVAANPAVLRLEFSEAVELGFSGMDFSGASGGALPLKDFRFADDAHKVVVANLPPLAPGLYRVKWHVVSVDTHRTEGQFTFTVRP
jgi:methionine-rich copper-binding protein CopC